MHLPSTALFLAAPLLALAKDCAIYYDYTLPEDSGLNKNSNTDRDFNARIWCSQFRGTIANNEVALVNRQEPNRCSICRGLPEPLVAPTFDIPDKNGGVTMRYTVACANFPSMSCVSA
ncbi:hypothetical protein PTTW11_09868 [Pyrenophora teres f. teres]|uniref:Uncharacterized protein n=1 Tax=Pyrenophora teres f. teres TaxID=97479 RepID=A0A6S6WIF8_9PLEO|nr:hypothetical protein PTTW11_09868 [Pyrenophora teres f. teres]